MPVDTGACRCGPTAVNNRVDSAHSSAFACVPAFDAVKPNLC